MNFLYWSFDLRMSLGKAFSACLFICALSHGGETLAVGSTADNANIMFNSYSNAFYNVNGTNAWFKTDQAGGVADFWEQAEEIECIIDACERTANTNYQVMTAHLLNGFEQIKKGNLSFDEIYRMQ